MKIDTHDIKALLESSISTYAISQKIEVARSTVQPYRTGKSKLENMTLGLAEKLQKFYEENAGK